MWTLLFTVPVTLIVGVICYVLLRRNQTKEPPVIFQKYQSLIDLLKEEGPLQLERASKHSLSFKRSLGADIWNYSLSEVDERLIVVWKLESRSHGTRGKEWSFNTSFDQQKMYSEIHTDLIQYNNLLFREN